MAASGDLDPRIRDMFYTMIDDMVISVVYHEPDEQLLSVMYKIFAYFGLQRLLRYSYEYALSGDTESDDILTRLSINNKLIHMHAVLLKQLEGTIDPNDKTGTDLESELQFLYPVRQDFRTQIANISTITSLEIKVKDRNATWLDVVQRIDRSVRSKTDKEKGQKFLKARVRHIDPYLLTDVQWDRVRLQGEIVDEDTVMSEVENEPEPTEPVVENEAQPPKEELPDTKEIEEKQKQIQRSSKRFKQQAQGVVEDVELSEEYFYETTLFFATLKLQLASANEVSEEVFALEDIVQAFLHSSSGYLKDFIEVLNDWKKQDSNALFSNESILKTLAKEEDEAKIKLLDILEKFGSKEASTIHDPKLEEVESSDSVHNAIQLWGSDLHYFDIKEHILRHLLMPKRSAESKESVCLLLDSVWPAELFSTCKDWVFQMNEYLLEKYDSLQNLDAPERSKQQYFGIGVLEILVDAYSASRKDLNRLISQSLKKGGSKGDKTNLSTTAAELLRTEVKIQKWADFVAKRLFHLGSFEPQDDHTLKCGYRFRWTIIHFERARTTNWQNATRISERIEEIRRVLLKLKTLVQISYANFDNIPELTSDSPQAELTMVSVLSTFAKVLGAKSGGDTNEAIKIMEKILLQTNAGEEDEIVISKLQSFLKVSPVEMSLSLWDVLFSFYDESGLLDLFKSGFEVYSDYILDGLKLGKYEETEATKKTVLIRVLGSFVTSLGKFVQMLEQSSWVVSSSPTVLALYLRLLELFYMFSLHEEASLITSRKSSVEGRSAPAYNAFKDTIVRLESLLIIYLRGHSSANDTRDLVALIHDQLGGRRMCDAAGGLFLRLNQDLLLQLDPKKFSSDVAQTLLCRFHCSLSIEGKSPQDHGTQSIEKFDKTTAETIARFVLPICFRTNPLSSTLKSDVRALVDLLYEEIGDPDIDTDIDARKGHEMLEFFLDSTSLSPRFMKNAFHGLVYIDFRNSDDPQSPKQSLAELGLYYLQASIIFTSYKIRKKSMQIRAVELEHVITLLQNDLIFCTWRAESWYLLGQVYGFFVQDELIWTADKQQSEEKKVGPANLQRKSLLCYLMAINHYAQNSHRSDLRPLVGQLMDSFSKELFNAYTEPMSMLAFKVTKNPRFINDGKGGEFTTVEKESVATKRICLKVLQQVLHLAIRAAPKEWSNVYLLSKTQRKAGMEPEKVVDTLLTACEAATKANNGVLEPKYKLCSVLYKYVKNKQVSIEYATKCLQEEFIFSTLVKSAKDFQELVIRCLREIIALDKKKWQHKPRYRLAKILLGDRGDTEGALEEMSSMVSVRSTGKPLVQIWKPDFERPGKHFCYTYQYACFYIEATLAAKQLSNLFFMMPKLKKSNPIMANTIGAWTLLFTSVCHLVRERCSITPDFSEKFIVFSIHGRLVEKMAFILQKIKNDGVPHEIQPYFCLNHDFTELKRLNSGFGPTALIDDTSIAIVVILHNYYNERYNLDQTISPVDTKIRKLSRKDIILLLTDLAKKTSSCYEQIMKDEPEIYTKFLKFEWADSYEIDNWNKRWISRPRNLAPKMVGYKLELGKINGLIGEKLNLVAYQIDGRDAGNNAKRPNEEKLPDTKRSKNGTAEAASDQENLLGDPTGIQDVQSAHTDIQTAPEPVASEPVEPEAGSHLSAQPTQGPPETK